MWNWMSAAGRPARVRTKAHDLGHRRGELAGAAQHPLGHRLGLVGAVERRPVGDLPEHVKNGWSWRLLPTPGDRGAPRRRPRASSSAGPMPESSSSCGEPIAPAARITSRSARATCSPPRRRGSERRSAGRPRARRRDVGARARPRGSARLQRRAQERVGRAPAPAVALRDLEHRRAVLLGPVVVGDRGMPAASLAARSARSAAAASAARRRAAHPRRRGTPTRRARCPPSAGSTAARRSIPSRRARAAQRS